jgi:hypothetical protein
MVLHAGISSSPAASSSGAIGLTHQISVLLCMLAARSAHLARDSPNFGWKNTSACRAAHVLRFEWTIRSIFGTADGNARLHYDVGDATACITVMLLTWLTGRQG